MYFPPPGIDAVCFYFLANVETHCSSLPNNETELINNEMENESVKYKCVASPIEPFINVACCMF